ncbi:ABC transporter permease [soil metagenome]
MFQNYFKTIYRHIFKNKVNFIFKLGGLALALFSFLVIALYISYQLSFDHFHKDYENIYRLNSIQIEDGKPVGYAIVPPALGAALKSEFAEVRSYAGISEWGSSLIRYNDKLLRIPGFVEADSTIFDVFTFKFLEGNEKALNDPRAIVIAKSSAAKIFGAENPMNKLISFPDRFNRILEVKAVIEDLPSNSSFAIDAIMNFGAMRDAGGEAHHPWEVGWGGNNLFLRMDGQADVSAFTKKIKPLLEKNLFKSADGREKGFSVYTQPLSDIYLGAPVRREFDKKGNSRYLYIYSSLAFFLLIIASINYLNLSIADFDSRSKEIGVRKILGARKKQIALQVTFETIIFCFLALLLSLTAVYLLFPQILKVLDSDLRLEMLASKDVMVLLIVTLFFLMIASTAYPAYRLALNNPMSDLKKGHGFGRGSSVSQILLLVQFSISVLCISATWIIGRQLNYIQIRDIGFDRQNIVELFMPDRYPVEKAPVLKNEITRIPGVESASFSYYHVTGVPYFKGSYQVEMGGAMKRMLVNEVFVDADFFKTLNLKLLSGRSFDQSNPADVQKAFIVNEAAVREFGWTDGIGKKMSIVDDENKQLNWDATVVGVVKDFNTRSLHETIEPLVMRLQYDSWPGYCLNIKINGDHKEVMKRIEVAYKRVLPEYLLDYAILEDRYNQQYQHEHKAYTTLQASTWIIVLISSLGILSLSVYMSMKRMKEFGIRKVVGASAKQISFLHVSSFLKIALLANIFSLPVAWWLMSEWLGDFAYRIEMDGYLFMVVGAVSFFLVIVSAGYSALKAGRMNPVDVIKIQ